MARISLLGLLVCVGACAPPSEEPGASPDPGPDVARSNVEVRPEPAVVVELTPEPEAHPEPEPKPESELAKFEPATRGKPGCVVTIHGLIEAQEYRGGGPMTPALEASLAANPDFARMYESESHGDHHIQCHYDVTLADKPGERFRWREVHSNTLRDLTTEICKADIGAIAERIVADTQQCTDFAAKAYWGHVLVPG